MVSFYYAPFRRARGEKREPRVVRPNWWRCWSELDDIAEIGEGAHQPSELQETSRPELDSAPQFELEAGAERPSMDPPHSSLQSCSSFLCSRRLEQSRRDILDYNVVIARAYDGDDAVSSISVHLEDPDASTTVNVETRRSQSPTGH